MDNNFEHYHTAFTVIDSKDIDSYLDISFMSLKRKARKMINDVGYFSITMTIDAQQNQDEE